MPFPSSFQQAPTGALLPSAVASAAEVKAGSAALKAVNPSALLAASGFSAYFQSNDQVITNAGALTIAHGLSRTPIVVQAFLRCITASAGYSAGDIIPVPITSIYAGGTVAKGVTVVADSMNLSVRYSDGGGSANTFAAIAKDTGSTSLLPNAQWSFFLRAWA